MPLRGACCVPDGANVKPPLSGKSQVRYGSKNNLVVESKKAANSGGSRRQSNYTEIAT